ncbi:MAG TPA: CpsD/CapB family tyrosine-protein kinase [Candidatus Limnocylindria bacterium]
MTSKTASFAPGRLDVIDLRPRIAQPRRNWLIPGADELFRSLYTGFEVMQGASFAVCSAVSGEGKTTISLGLALAIAQDLPDKRVVVVETDLWHPVLAKDFGIETVPGLVDSLLDRAPVLSTLRSTSLDNLSLVVAGGAVAGAQRLLRSARMPQIIEELRRTHDVLILDTPAALAHSEVALLARMVDDVVFVVRTGVTPAHALTSALGRIQGAKVRGIIVNDARSSVPGAVRQLVHL